MDSNGTRKNRPPQKNPKSGKKKMTAKERAKKKRRSIILFVTEIFVLLILVVVLWGVIKTTKNVTRFEINEDEILISDEVKENKDLKGYRNIALFGVDARDGSLGKGNRTDTIMIASINEDTKEVKLVSVYRDTYLNLGNDSYSKCNSAYAFGGPEQAVGMLNTNLDLNITDYITVGFKGLVDCINELGGVMIEVDEAEIEHLNNYQICIAEDLGTKYTPVRSTGYQLLDGMQATAYCRIRYTAGDDFKRAERQREVLMAVAEQAKTMNVSTLNGVANKVFPNIVTSLKLDEIVSLLGGITSYEVKDNSGFPFDEYRATGNISGTGSSVIPVSLENNVKMLHEFLFAVPEYEVSESVKTYSNKITNNTAPFIKK